jgi:hypothetical protein
MINFEDTVKKFVSNVEEKKVNKDKEEAVVINKEGDKYILSQIDNVYIILHATDENADSGREFIGHIIKKFLDIEKNDMEKLKIFLNHLLNAPNRLHNETFMHYFSINLVGNNKKVELLEDLIKLGGYIELERIGERENKKDEKKIENIKERLRKSSIENTINKKYYDQEVVKAVGETSIGNLPEELERKILSYRDINLGGKRRKSLKKKRKSKRRKSLKKKQRKTKRKSRR